MFLIQGEVVEADEQGVIVRSGGVEGVVGDVLLQWKHPADGSIVYGLELGTLVDVSVTLPQPPPEPAHEYTFDDDNQLTHVDGRPAHQILVQTPDHPDTFKTITVFDDESASNDAG